MHNLITIVLSNYERVDGTRAQILIGTGLDFIQADGRVKPTYIVVQDPLTDT